MPGWRSHTSVVSVSSPPALDALGRRCACAGLLKRSSASRMKVYSVGRSACRLGSVGISVGRRATERAATSTSCIWAIVCVAAGQRSPLPLSGIHSEVTATRTEKDPLGELEVPADAYYGVQTARAIANFPISGRRPDIALVRPPSRSRRPPRVRTNTGRLSPQLAAAIIQAADEVLGLRSDSGHRRGPRPAGEAHRQLPRRPLPGGRRRQPQHEHQRGARQPGDRDPGRARASAVASAATTRSSTPTTT